MTHSARPTQYHPLLSVIIATRDRARLLARAIRSIIDQTFPDFELIVVDDASIDDTRVVVEGFSDQRIVYIRRSENGGVSAALSPKALTHSGPIRRSIHVMQVIDADAHVNDGACRDEIGRYMPEGNRSRQIFPALDHLHFYYLRPERRRELGNSGPKEWLARDAGHLL